MYIITIFIFTPSRLSGTLPLRDGKGFMEVGECEWKLVKQ
jgi:hypothetical protein